MQETIVWIRVRENILSVGSFSLFTSFSICGLDSIVNNLTVQLPWSLHLFWIIFIYSIEKWSSLDLETEQAGAWLYLGGRPSEVCSSYGKKEKANQNGGCDGANWGSIYYLSTHM